MTKPTIQQEIEDMIAQEKKPLGQRVYEAGFRKVILSDLEDAFCCAELTEKQKEKTKADLVEFAKTREWRNVDVRQEQEATLRERMADKVFGGYIEFNAHNYEWARQSYQKCIVEFSDLETYVGDAIPDRCLISVANAKKAGIQNIKVAYPVLVGKEMRVTEENVTETKSTPEEGQQAIMMSTPLKDPIIVGVLDDNNMVEIDRWE